MRVKMIIEVTKQNLWFFHISLDANFVQFGFCYHGHLCVEIDAKNIKLDNYSSDVHQLAGRKVLHVDQLETGQKYVGKNIRLKKKFLN